MFNVCQPGYFSIPIVPQCNNPWSESWLDRFCTEKCRDIDECAYADLYKCSDNSDCLNTDGSFSCVCKQGYESMGEQCVDIDECKLHDCPDNSDCHNVQGSYTCICYDGFVGPIELGGMTQCFNINECLLFNDTCASGAMCEDRNGGFACSCPSNMLGTGKYGDPCIKEVVCGRKIQTGCYLF